MKPRSRKFLALAISLGLVTTIFSAAPSAFAASASVTYNANGASGTPPTDSTVHTVGDSVTVAGQNGLYKNGYSFGGWASGGGLGPGTTYQPGASFTISGDTQMTAVWNAVSYSVTYNGNGFTSGTLPVDNNNYSYGNTVTVAGQNGLAKTGYTFGGWSYSGGLGPSVVTSFSIQANTTLTAVWNVAATLTMTYNGSGSTSGTAPVDPSSPYISGATVTLQGAGTLVKTGYSFGGWMDCVVNTHYGATFIITAITTVCPIWTINPYAVHYLATGSTSGTPPNDPNSPYVSGATVTVLGAGSLVKTGSHFGGWADADTHITTGPTFIILKVTDLDPVWIPDVYTVTYDGNCSNSCGSVPIDGTSYSPNASVTVGAAPNANYSGFHFTGWANGGLAVYQPGADFTIVSNTVLTAVWVKNVTYTVTYFPYQTSGGIPPIDILSPYSSGDVVFVATGPGTLYKTGYTFNGWGNCPAVNSVGTSFVITQDTTLCSLWIVNPKFKVTYNGNGNSGGSVPSPTIGSGTVTLATNTGSLVKSAYTFGGWNTRSNGLGTPYAVGAPYNLIADVTLYAIWTPANVIYKITYDGNGNSTGTAPPQTVGAGAVALATNSGALTKVGQHLTGWNTNAAGTGLLYPLGASYYLSANITLYALWEPNTYTITYDGNGNTSGVVPNPTVGSGPVTLATNSGALAKSGSSYVGWNTAADGSGTSYSVGDPYTLSANITMYAVWLPTTYSVTYVGNGNTGGSVPVDITAYSSGGTVIVLGPNTLLKTGYTFGGWALGGLMIYAPGQTFTITSDVTLTAIWTPNIVYTITYDGNGNTGGNAPGQTVGSGLVSLATNSGALVKSGASFAGWNTASDGSGTPYAVGSPYTLNANVTLYAVWIGGGIINYTITYNGNGFTGGTAPSPTVGLGSVSLATNSGSLVKSGSTFGGWNTIADGSGIPYAVGSNYNLIADVTLYAVWHAVNIDYTITYLGNGYTSGSEPAPTVGLGSVTLATNSGLLAKSGSTYGGWNTTADGSGIPYSVSSNYTLLANVTLYAVWHPVSVVYTITYIGNSNTSGVAPHPTVGVGSVNLAMNSSPLVKSGSVFGGWNSSASGSGTPYAVGSGYTLIADISLYAVWSAGNPLYTITYSGNSNTGGVVPTPTVGSGSVTLAANSSPLVKSGFTFGGWNTKADGAGTSYAERDNYNLTANVTLYAVWSTATTYTITYLGNGNTNGTAPGVTQGSGLVVLAANTGSLAKSGSTFAGWNTKADRSGTSYLVSSNFNLVANVTVFAAYIPLPLSETLPDLIANGKIINTSPQKKIALNQIVPVHQKFQTVLPSNAVAFELYENGKLINRGTSNSVDLTQIVGPKDRVTVVAVGKEGLKSMPAPVSLAKEPISLANINFNTDSFKFIGPATKILDQVAAVIIQHGYTTLEIWGYVDTQGSKASWITLSNNRAKAVKDYMTKKLKGSGVIIRNAGRAQTQAVGNNNTPEGRALNRRVEIRVS